jgi:hypothetical protein
MSSTSKHFLLQLLSIFFREICELYPHFPNDDAIPLLMKTINVDPMDSLEYNITSWWKFSMMRDLDRLQNYMICQSTPTKSYNDQTFFDGTQIFPNQYDVKLLRSVFSRNWNHNTGKRAHFREKE